MQTKLTLRLDRNLIQAAKQYSAQRGKSLSQVVAEYFYLLTVSNGAKTFGMADEQLPPVTRTLKGMLKGSDVSVDDYKKHLEKKYL